MRLVVKAKEILKSAFELTTTNHSLPVVPIYDRVPIMLHAGALVVANLHLQVI